MRSWSIELWLLNEQGEQIPATIFEKVMYELHPTFAKPKQSMYSFMPSICLEIYQWRARDGDYMTDCTSERC